MTAAAPGRRSRIRNAILTSFPISPIPCIVGLPSPTSTPSALVEAGTWFFHCNRRPHLSESDPDDSSERAGRTGHDGGGECTAKLNAKRRERVR